MQCAPRFALVTLFLMALAACGRSQVSVLGPSPLGGSPAQLASESSTPLFGAWEQGVHNSAGQASGFGCGLFGFPADHSHATISESGNQTQHCSGKTTLPPLELVVPCPMFFGGVDPEGQFTVNPSGHASLKCQVKKD